MARIVRDYFAPDWRSEVLACVCGWQGDSAGMVMELDDEVTDYACPGCEATLLIVSHPDLEQVRDAAARGITEAQQQLALIEEALATYRGN